MNQDLFLCAFFNRAEIMTHFSSARISSKKPQQPPAENVFLGDCGQTTILQLVPSRAQVCMSPSRWQHQGWQGAGQSQQGSTDLLPTSPRAAWGSIMVGLPRAAAGMCRSTSGNLQASSYAEGGCTFAQECTVLHTPHVGSCRAAQALPKLQGSVLGAGG